MTEPKIAVCIGCGCDDLHACRVPDLARQNLIKRGPPMAATTCCWVRVDRAIGLGVCSECHLYVEFWDEGDRSLNTVARERMSRGVESRQCSNLDEKAV